jgi:hypothetical protein
MLEEDDPLWKKIFFNELVWAFVAGVVILYFAFTLATGKSEDPDEKPKTKKVAR